MPYIQNDIPTTLAVTGFIAEYLNMADTVVLSGRVESIVLQNVLQWLRSEIFGHTLECYANFPYDVTE